MKLLSDCRQTGSDARAWLKYLMNLDGVLQDQGYGGVWIARLFMLSSHASYPISLTAKDEIRLSIIYYNHERHLLR